MNILFLFNSVSHWMSIVLSANNYKNQLRLCLFILAMGRTQKILFHPDSELSTSVSSFTPSSALFRLQLMLAAERRFRPDGS